MKFKNVIKAVCIILATLILLSSCANKGNEATVKGITFTDKLGNEITVNKDMKTAVLSGSLADAWVKAGGTLSAVTEDYFSLTGTEKDSITSLGSITEPNLELLADNGIEFVILSANIKDQVALKDKLIALGLKIAYFDVETFSEYSDMMKIFTDITGREDLFKTNVTDVKSVIDEQIKRNDASQPRILLLRAYSSGVKAKGSDNMVGVMLKDLGCINIADTDSLVDSDLSLEQIVAANPDYIFVTTMGKQEAALKTVETNFSSNSAWANLDAVKNGKYFVLEKSLFQNKPNEKWGEAYKKLADILYGETNAQ